MPVLSIFGTLILISYFGMKEAKNIRSLKDFAFSKGSFSTFSLVATIVASVLGGGMVIGTAEKSYSIGIAPIIGLLGFSLQLFIVGQFIAKRLYRYNNDSSPGEILSSHYGKASQIMIGLCWTLFCLGLLSGQMLALGRILSLFVPISPHLNNLLASSFLILYCLLGGIRAVILTDRLQFWVIVVILPALLAFLIFLFVKTGHTTRDFGLSQLSPFAHMTPLALSALFIGFLMGDILIPSMIQRVQLAKNYFQAKKAYIISAVIIFVFTIICGALGLFISVLKPGINPSELISTFFNEVLPLPFQILGAIALLAVIMSSADSYLNSLAFVFVRDFYQPLKKTTLSDKGALYAVRWLTLIFGYTAYFLSIYGKNSYDLMITSCKFWGPVMGIPILYALYNKVISKRGFFMTTSLSFISVLAWEILKLERATSVSSLLIGILVSFLTYQSLYLLKSSRGQSHEVGHIAS